MIGTHEDKQAKLDEHVAYEVRMCGLQSAELLHGRGGLNWVTYNALLEASLVHVRNLTAFMEIGTGRVRADDVTVADYLDGWHAAPQAAADLLEATFTDIHKHIAHLTSGTDEGDEKKTWSQLGFLAASAIRAMREFADVLAAHGVYATAAITSAVEDAEDALAAVGYLYTDETAIDALEVAKS